MSDFPSKVDAAIDRIARASGFEEAARTVTFRQPDPVAPAVTLQSAAEDLANACAEVERITASIAKVEMTLRSLREELNVAGRAHEMAQAQFSRALAESAKARAKASR